ncbi:MAG: hypothetical protein HY907_01080 [Deltaproteobacteria bacterium]|nr:hypothetical protein [Deltaproteobacteria bacterium]
MAVTFYLKEGGRLVGVDLLGDTLLRSESRSGAPAMDVGPMELDPWLHAKPATCSPYFCDGACATVRGTTIADSWESVVAQEVVFILE